MNERIKEIRKALDLTLEKFGERLGVSKTAISRLETGVNNISNRMVLSICKEFNVNEDWLRTGEGEMFIQMDPDDELAEIVGRVLAGEDEFTKALFRQIGKLDQQYLDMLKVFVKNLYEDMNK